MQTLLYRKAAKNAKQAADKLLLIIAQLLFAISDGEDAGEKQDPHRPEVLRYNK